MTFPNDYTGRTWTAARPAREAPMARGRPKREPTLTDAAVNVGKLGFALGWCFGSIAFALAKIALAIVLLPFLFLREMGKGP